MAAHVYRNLIPDSHLHRALEGFLRRNGWVASAEEICSQVFMLPTAPPGLARALVEALIEGDTRLRLTNDNRVECSEPTAEEIWQRKHFLVVDAETTDGTLQGEPSGRARRDPRIIELGVCRVEEGRITDQWSQLLNPDRPLSPWVRRLTGISDAMLVTAPRFADIADRLLDQLEDAILVAHHARFDVAVISSELSRLLGQRLGGYHLCTVELARHFLPGMENYRLETLSRSLCLRHERPHRAGSDARATAELFTRLAADGGDALAAHLRPRVRPEQKEPETVETRNGRIS